MKRIHEKKIDDAEYCDTKIWAQEVNTRPYYDAVRMRALLKPATIGDRILDVGAGVYGACQYLAEHNPEWVNCDSGCTLIAIDQSKVAKKIVDDMNLPMKYYVSQVENLPFTNKEWEKFDVVIAGEIIEHMESPQDFVKELARVCRAGGTISLSTVNTHSANAIKHGDYPEHLWEFEPEDLIKFFEPYGRAKYETVGDYHFIYCKKV